jgi:hypothetical protein
MRFSQALVTAVTDAGRAILAIFGYVLLFSAVFGLISPYLGASPWVRTMAGGLLEVTFGCAAASRLGGWSRFCAGSVFYRVFGPFSHLPGQLAHSFHKNWPFPKSCCGGFSAAG